MTGETITEENEKRLVKLILLTIKMYNIAELPKDNPELCYYRINHLTKIALYKWKEHKSLNSYGRYSIGLDRLCKVALHLEKVHAFHFDKFIMKKLYKFMEIDQDYDISLKKLINGIEFIELLSIGFIKNIKEEKLPIQQFLEKNYNFPKIKKK